jgi:hypothetical protein
MRKHAALVLACLLGLAFQAWVVSQQGEALIQGTIDGHNDFLQLYVGGKLCGTGELYSLEANQREQRAAIGKISPSVRFSRLPFYAVLLRPLTALRYRTAYGLFQAWSVAALIGFAWLMAPECRLLLPLLCFSIPLTAAFRQGQDLMFVLLAVALFYRWSRQGRGWWAGLVLSVGLIKFHLLVLVWLALVARRQWPEVKGALAGGLAALALCFAGGGINWMGDYLALLRDPALHPSPSIMPNLHGLAMGNAWVEMTASLVVVALLMAAARREADFGAVLALALLGGLLISRHAYIQDAVVVLPALALLDKVHTSGLGKLLLLLFCLPLGALLQLMDPPVSQAAPALLLAGYMALALASVRGVTSVMAPRPT